MRVLVVAGVAAVALAGLGGSWLAGSARTPAAYYAKTLCSEIFLAGRPGRTVARDEFRDISPAFAFVTHSIDRDAKSVSASIYRLGAATASFRGADHGCALDSGGPPEAPAPLPEAGFALGLATGESARVDRAAVENALNEAMAREADGHRAFILVVDGQIVAERYADGFSERTPFLSWSMAKSVLATLVGAAADRGYVDLSAPAPVAAWAGDARAAITWEDLLRMETGLAFDESYGAARSDVNLMLFQERDMGAFAAAKPALHSPGAHWAYSSGTSNILGRTLQGELAARGVDLFAFARKAVFAPIGARSFVLETDAAGHFAASSYVYATARDWAALGQLYLAEGRASSGEAVLSDDWVRYVQEPAPASDNTYGAHFWLNRDEADGDPRWLPSVPESAYYMAGHDGQYVVIVPSKNVVVVRTGMTRKAPAAGVAGPVIEELIAAVAG